FRTFDCPPRKLRIFSINGRVCWGSRVSAMTCGTCLAELNPKLAWRWITSYIVWPKRSVPWLQFLGASTGSFSLRVSVKTRRKFVAESAMHALGWVSSWTTRLITVDVHGYLCRTAKSQLG